MVPLLITGGLKYGPAVVSYLTNLTKKKDVNEAGKARAKALVEAAATNYNVYLQRDPNPTEIASMESAAILNDTKAMERVKDSNTFINSIEFKDLLSGLHGDTKKQIARAAVGLGTEKTSSPGVPMIANGGGSNSILIYGGLALLLFMIFKK